MNSQAKKDVAISKALSWLLRHGALKERLPINTEGFVPVNCLLNCKRLQVLSICESDIRRIVQTNDKQRFNLRVTEAGVLEIRANQGHSLDNVVNLELIPITNASKVENVIHGTFLKHWTSIKSQGLHRGNRNHIHFASNTDSASGIRRNAQIFIYIDLEKALFAGLLFYLSTNNVLLSPGNTEGYIKPNFFLKVVRAADGFELNF